jgi:hypothetical protein
VPESPANDQELALLQTETWFISDPDRNSLDYWYAQRCHGLRIPWERMQEYARTNLWLERRQAFWRGVESAYLKQQQVRYLQQLAAELDDATNLRAKVYHLINPKVNPKTGAQEWPVLPKSLEGMIRALAVLDDMVESKRDRAMAVMNPMIEAADAQKEALALPGQEVHFTAAEMRQLAHGLLRQRRAARRKQLGIEDDDEDTIDVSEDEVEGPPAPKVIDVTVEEKPA